MLINAHADRRSAGLRAIFKRAYEALKSDVLSKRVKVVKLNDDLVVEIYSSKKKRFSHPAELNAYSYMQRDMPRGICHDSKKGHKNDR